MNHLFTVLMFTCSLLTVCLPTYAVQSNFIAPPNVDLVDERGVNIATGQVQKSVETVALGGEFGLRHSIRVYANHFNALRGYGYIDKYAGAARYKKLSKRDSYVYKNSDDIVTFELKDNNPQQYTYQYAMRVFGPHGGQDFVIYKNGVYLLHAGEITSGYSYVPIGDSRHSLTVETSNGDTWMIWRDPDGIETRYRRTPQYAQYATTGGLISSITYPNGFKIYIDTGGVSTNTGFMLKYDAPEQWRQEGYWGDNPHSISGINLAHQYCSPDVSASVSSCNISQWPTAHFDWPESTPEIFHTQSSSNRVFSVTDQYGGVTEFHYQAQNVCLYRVADQSGEDSICAGKYEQQYAKWSPRLIGVKSATSKVLDKTYSYENEGTIASRSSTGAGLGVSFASWYWDLATKEGRVSKATNKNQSLSYGKAFPLDEYNARWAREADGNRVESQSLKPGILDYVKLRKSGEYYFEENSRNLVTRYIPVSGPRQTYAYDTRGNLTSITANNTIIQEAAYPTSCSATNYSYKNCNKPLWIKDARGNVTDYQWSHEHGQLLSAEGPAVEVSAGVSVRPKTIHQYSQYYAYYKNASGSIVRADDPIWLLSETHTCRTSATTAQGCQSGDLDRVKTEYYYGPQSAGVGNNLLLRGKSITAEGNAGQLETRVWCYAYDKLGNKTSETHPKGNTNLQSCP